MLQSINLNNVLIFWGELNCPVALLYDATISNDFLTRINQKAPNLILINIEKLSQEKEKLSDDVILFCFSLKSEQELLKKLEIEKIKKIKKIYLVVNEILPRMISTTGISGKYIQGTFKLDETSKQPVLDKNNIYYAIFSTPRSGSSFFCSLLQNNGLGLPKEHLRNEPAYLMNRRQQGGFSLITFFETIAKHSTKNGYFGTKIIGHFLEDVIKASDEEEKKYFLKEWLPKFKYIYLYRSDKVLQAISVYRAQETKFWHQWHGDNKSKGKLNYDFQKIENWYNKMIKQEDQLLKRISQLKEKFNCPIASVNYESLVKNPEDIILSEVYPLLKCAKTSVISEVLSKQIHGEVEKEIANKFMEEYKTQYSKEVIRKFEANL